MTLWFLLSMDMVLELRVLDSFGMEFFGISTATIPDVPPTFCVLVGTEDMVVTGRVFLVCPEGDFGIMGARLCTCVCERCVLKISR